MSRIPIVLTNFRLLQGPFALACALKILWAVLARRIGGPACIQRALLGDRRTDGRGPRHQRRNHRHPSRDGHTARGCFFDLRAT